MAAPQDRSHGKENTEAHAFRTPKKTKNGLPKPLPATRQRRSSDSSDDSEGSSGSSSESSDEHSQSNDSDSVVDSVADDLDAVDLSSHEDEGKESRRGGHHRTRSFVGRVNRFSLKDHHLKDALRECNNTCPISGLPFPSGEEGNKYHLDHDHALEDAGLPIQFSVRGPLSPRMNRVLGKNLFNDSPVKLARAISFLRRPRFKSHFHGVIASQGASSDHETLTALGTEVDWDKLLTVYRSRQQEEAELRKILQGILEDEHEFQKELTAIIKFIKNKIKGKATERRNKQGTKEIGDKKINKGKSTKISYRD